MRGKMSISKDLHICGECKKIFSELDLFLKHKSQCSNDAESSKPPKDISVDNILFPVQPMLDLTELGNENFPFLLHYDNEEVVIDDHEQHVRKDHSPVEQLSRLLESDNVCRPTTSNETKSGLVITKEDSLLENAHLKNTNDSKRKNVCTICNYTAAYQRDLIRHMRKHTGERPYVCCYCNKTFARKDKLREHKRIHVGDKRFKCHLCSYASTDSGPLRKHLLIHTDHRPYKCQLCSYRARHASHLTVHIRTHTGDTPFFCQAEACGRVFKTGTDLNRHKKLHKRSRLSPTPSVDDESEKFVCKHLTNVRLLNKTTSCHVCQALSQKGECSQRSRGRPRQGRVRGVGRRVRCAKSHQCPHCTAAFVRGDSLRSHVRQHRFTTPLHDEHNKQEQEQLSPKHQIPDVLLIEPTTEDSCFAVS